MSKFFSQHEKQIDAKGRVSVPAPFRAVHGAAGGERIYCFPSLNEAENAIECYPPDAYFALLEQIEGIIESPEAREQLEWAVITRGVELTFDGEGRVSFPERLLKSAGIEKAVMFAGRGDRFQIMTPETFTRTDSAAGRTAGQLRHLLMKGPRSPALPTTPKTERAE